ncbi:BCCT family transporter [Arthrobacter mobilis]|uniref:BCCT family transporter n=1 Tax=Arthrobacter mobilis TaxID=2724944 RepID=A0A7X6K7E4_9MICC|nr:BCCT family transporter [Arthrobacter mobilis]NKX56533.1 BCCT family transporter [Arthrobacter mobilis]
MSTGYSRPDVPAAEAAPAPPVDDTANLHHTEAEEAQILGELRDGVEKRRSSLRKGFEGLDKTIFAVTGALVIAFVAWGFINTDSLSAASAAALDWVLASTGWVFVLLASLFVIYILWVALGRFGTIPLGKDGERPEFRTASWIAMMFACGMGIGLMFYGVAEPLYHYISPPPATADGQTPEAIETAMATTLFHWTLHPWAIYAVVGLAIAYSTFRMGRRNLVSEAFVSLFGRRAMDGAGGKFINILAIFSTLFGSATSLGVGALQIGSGLQFNGVVGQVGTPLLVLIIAVLTVCFVASAVSGIERGIQYLANTNMVLAVLMAIIVFVVGPTLFVLNLIPSAIGSFAEQLPEMAARTEASGDEAMRQWLSGWTVFYWAWWISWTPFVGMFVARISRGRTIRQFVTGVLLVPSLVSLIWFAIFGGTAIDIQRRADATADPSDGIATIVDGSPTISFDGALFAMFSNLGTPQLVTVGLAVLAMILTSIFFITGADSASIVMGSMSSRGTLEPSRPVVIFWGTLIGAVAAVMLLAGGDTPSEALVGVQRITIVAALPIVLMMLVMCIALTRDLYRDPIWLRQRLSEQVMRRTIRTAVDEYGHRKFTLATRESAEPPTGQIQAVDATAAGQPIYASETGKGRRPAKRPGAETRT